MSEMMLFDPWVEGVCLFPVDDPHMVTKGEQTTGMAGEWPMMDPDNLVSDCAAPPAPSLGWWWP